RGRGLIDWRLTIRILQVDDALPASPRRRVAVRADWPAFVNAHPHIKPPELVVRVADASS
ncbi:MAG: hypothetical protein ACREA0_27380, partial [bacterium]